MDTTELRRRATLPRRPDVVNDGDVDVGEEEVGDGAGLSLAARRMEARRPLVATLLRLRYESEVRPVELRLARTGSALRVNAGGDT